MAVIWVFSGRKLRIYSNLFKIPKHLPQINWKVQQCSAELSKNNDKHSVLLFYGLRILETHQTLIISWY